MDNAFSNRLLHVPLFHGFSRLDFLDIVEQTPFDFSTIAPGKVLVRQGAECRSLCILMGGEALLEVESPDGTYRFGEHVKAPWAVQLECLFGLHNHYSRTVRAVSELQAVAIDKQSVRRLLTERPTFQINFYNALSTFAQQADRQLWHAPAESLAEKFVHFVSLRSLRPVGAKELHIRMEDLALQLDATRLRVSKLLASLAAADLIEYSRGRIYIPALEQLTAYLIRKTNAVL